MKIRIDDKNRCSFSRQTTESCKKVTAHIQQLTDCPSADHANASRHLIVVRRLKVLVE
jgi:hypothetical protein